MGDNRGIRLVPGAKYGKLTVLKYAGLQASPTRAVNARQSMSLCRCDCGAEVLVANSELIRGRRHSCGCMRRKSNYIHGLSKTRLFNIWAEMRQRTMNPNNRGYADYGGRGIRICDEWSTFIPFREWALANGYSDELSIDRIDPNRGYSPDNCRWATKAVQSINQRVTIKHRDIEPLLDELLSRQDVPSDLRTKAKCIKEMISARRVVRGKDVSGVEGRPVLT